MRDALRTVCVIGATLMLASCSLFGDKEKELEPKELVSIEQKVRIRKAWSANLGGDAEFLRVALRPVSDGNRIYAASRNGNVAAFDPDSGKQVWRSKLDIDLSAGPGVGANHVVVITVDGNAILLDASTGAEKWRADIDGESLARPVIKNDLVIVQTIDNQLRALSLFDGRERWSVVQTTPVLTMRGSSSPVVAGTAVVAGFDNGRLVSVSLDTGDVNWNAMLSPPKGRSDLDRLADLDGEITVIGQDIYAAGYQGRLASLAAESGQVLWSRELSSYVGVSADWNSVYTTRDNGEIVALVRSSGVESWRNDALLRREPTLPVPFNTMVVVGDLEGYLHFFNNFDGAPVARVRHSGKAVTSNPIVVGNRLVVQGDGGTITAYEVVDQQPKRKAPDVATDGT